MIDHRLEERGQVGSTGSGLPGGPTLPPRRIQEWCVELRVAGLQIHQKLEHLVVNLIRPGVGTVHLVDHDQRQQSEGECLAGHEAGLGHRSLGRVDQQQHAVHHAQNALHLAAEVGVPGRVDDVDLGAPPMDGGVLRKDGDAALPLQRIGVHDAVADDLAFAEHTGLPEHLVDKRGLAVIDVSDDGDVAEIHGRSLDTSMRVKVKVPIRASENGDTPLRLLIGCLGDESSLPDV